MKFIKLYFLLFVFTSSVCAQLKVDSIGRVLITNPNVCLVPSCAGLEVHSTQRPYENIVFGTKSFVNGGYGEYTSIGVLGATEGDPFIRSTIGLYGSTTISLYLPSVDGYYAGYFQGDVRATGALYGTLLSPTSLSSGNVERIFNQNNNEENFTVTDKLNHVDLLQMQRINQDGSIAANTEIDTKIEEKTKQTKLSSTSYGLAADQLKEVFPELVYEDKEGNFSINYVEMVPLLVQSIRELSAEVTELRKQMGLEKTVNKSKQQTTAIEKTENTKSDKNSTTYDLSGRPIANPQRGIFVKDGKKITVK